MGYKCQKKRYQYNVKLWNDWVSKLSVTQGFVKLKSVVLSKNFCSFFLDFMPTWNLNLLNWNPTNNSALILLVFNKRECDSSSTYSWFILLLVVWRGKLILILSIRMFNFSKNCSYRRNRFAHCTSNSSFSWWMCIGCTPSESLRMAMHCCLLNLWHIPQ